MLIVVWGQSRAFSRVLSKFSPRTSASSEHWHPRSLYGVEGIERPVFRSIDKRNNKGPRDSIHEWEQHQKSSRRFNQSVTTKDLGQEVGVRQQVRSQESQSMLEGKSFHCRRKWVLENLPKLLNLLRAQLWLGESSLHHMPTPMSPSMKYKSANQYCQKTLKALELYVYYTFKKCVSSTHLSPNYSQSLHSKRGQQNNCPRSPQPGTIELSHFPGTSWV